MKIGDYVRTKNGMIAKIIDKKDLVSIGYKIEGEWHVKDKR